MAINSKLIAGQYIISKNNQLFIADANKKILSQVESPVPPLLAHGDSKMRVTVASGADKKIRLDVIVTTTGESEKI